MAKPDNGIDTSEQELNDTPVHKVLSVCITLLSGDKDTLSKELTQAGEATLAACLKHSAITASKEAEIGVSMGRQNRWEAWAVVCTMSDAALESSVETARDALSDKTDPIKDRGALSAIRTLLQGAAQSSSLSKKVGVVMKGAGMQLMGLFKEYATLALPLPDVRAERMSVVGNAMKVLLLTYQDMSSNEQMLHGYLKTVFELWVEVIRFNGLPNQASPQQGADPNVGRMMAQAIVHVARTTPAAFKATMPVLSDHGRAIVELAVRAEMSGYASSAARAPPKKKLSLAGFKK